MRQLIKRLALYLLKKNRKFFWAQVTKETIENMIDKGIMFCRAYDKSVAIQGRKYTKRKMDK